MMLKTAVVSLCSVASIVLVVGTLGGDQTDTSPQGQLLRNAGFEGGGGDAPEAWIRDQKYTGNKGSVSTDRSRSHSGRTSLKLQPNSRNADRSQDFPLAVAQVIPAGEYRGRTVEFSAHVQSEGSAIPTVGMLNFIGSRGSDLQSVSPSEKGTGWVRVSQRYLVPDSADVQLVVTCFVTGKSGAAWFDDVSVVPVAGPASSTRAARIDKGAGSVLKAVVGVEAGRVIREIPRTLYGVNVEWIWNGNYLWNETTRDLDARAVQLTKDLGASLIRYPGGQYADFFHWKQGIGSFDQRPEAVHAAGKGDRSRPNFGTDEVLQLAAEANGEALITVNAGTGDAREAAEWVRYVNNGSRRVRYWEIGNELYMNEGSATSRAITVSPGKYAERFNEFARAMKEADPGIAVGAIGGENRGRYVNVNYPDWNRTVLEKAGGQMDFLAVHNAYAPVLITREDQDMRKVYRAMLAAPVLIARNLKVVEQQIATYAPNRASQIGIAVTEWGPLFQFDPKSAYVDHPKTLGSALFVASTLKAFVESARTQIANFWLLNDLSVLGMIGSREAGFPPKPDWAPTARYFAFQLFTRYFGDQLVQSTVEGPTYNSEAVGLIDSVDNVPYLDIVSSLSTDRRTLFIIAINKNFDSSIESSITLRDFNPAPEGIAWTLTGSGIDANTGTMPLRVPGLSWGKQIEDSGAARFYHGGQGEVTLSSAPVTGVANGFTYRFPPHSATSLILTRAQ